MKKILLAFTLPVLLSPLALWSKSDEYLAPDLAVKKYSSPSAPVKAAGHGPEWGFAHQSTSSAPLERGIASEKEEITVAPVDDGGGLSDDTKKTEENYYRYPSSSEDENYRPQQMRVKPWRYDTK